MPSRIAGTGRYLPEKVLSNAELAQRVDTSDEWIRTRTGIRQRHIDQAQSMNLYITTEYTMRQVLDLYLLAWEKGVKTLYYVRSKALEVEDCDSCTA